MYRGAVLKFIRTPTCCGVLCWLAIRRKTKLKKTNHDKRTALEEIINARTGLIIHRDTCVQGTHLGTSAIDVYQGRI